MISREVQDRILETIGAVVKQKVKTNNFTKSYIAEVLQIDRNSSPPMATVKKGEDEFQCILPESLLNFTHLGDIIVYHDFHEKVVQGSFSTSGDGVLHIYDAETGMVVSTVLQMWDAETQTSISTTFDVFIG